MKKSRADQALETKAKIIEAAMDLLSTEGINGLTSGKLAKKLSMSKGTLFHHYESMEDLHVAVLDTIIDSTAQELRSSEFNSAKELVEMIVDSVFKGMEQNRVGYAGDFNFIGSAESNEVYRTKLKAMFETAIDRWAVLLSEKLQKDIPREKLYDMIRLIDMHFAGLLTHNIIFQDPETYRALTTRFLHMVISDLD